MLVSGRIENFAKYSQFKSLKAFNNTIEMFLTVHKKDFTKSELIAFKRLVRFSAKFVGVANAKISKLLKAIHEKAGDLGIGVSRSTLERMLTKAKELGILTIKSTRKPKGGKGHNVYVFNKFDVSKKEKLTYCENHEISTESKDEQADFEGEAIDLLETNNHKNINKRTKDRSNVYKRLDHSFVGNWIPKEFVQVVKPFFDDAKTIKEFWRIVKINSYKYKETMNADKILGIAIHSFRQTYRKLKNLDNPFGWFTTVLQNQLVQALSKEPDYQVMKPSIHRKPIRTEMVPDWLAKDKAQEREPAEIKKPPMTEERKKAIWDQVKKMNNRS